MYNKKIYVSVLMLSIIFILIGCREQKDRHGQEESNLLSEIYFTKWKGYLAYEKGHKERIEIPFVTAELDSSIIDDIEKISFMGENIVFESSSFKLVKGSENQEVKIQTLSASVEFQDAGEYLIDTIQIELKEGSVANWNIGEIEIEVIEQEQPLHAELGVRLFIDSIFDRYMFFMKNVAKSEVVILELAYNSKFSFTCDEMYVSDSFDNLNNIENNVNYYEMAPDETKAIGFEIKGMESEPFFMFKPRLIYTFEGNKYYMFLDKVVYSSTFTEEIINEILENKAALISP